MPSFLPIGSRSPSLPRVVLGLRSWMLLLALASAAPLLLALALGGRLQAQDEERARALLMREKANAVAQAVGSELRLAAGLLQVVASPQPGEASQELLLRAARTVRAQRLVREVRLVGPDGSAQFSASAQAVTQPLAPASVCAATLAASPPTRERKIRLVQGAGRGEAAWTVLITASSAVAAASGCEWQAVLPMQDIGGLLRTDHWPDSWVVALVDERYRIIARSKLADEYVGQIATPPLQRAIEARNAQVFESYARDGTPVLATTAPVPGAGDWHVALGIARSVVDAELRPRTDAFIAACVVAVALAWALAWLFGNRIAHEVRQIGQVPDASADLLPASRVREAQDAIRQLQGALQARRASEQAREATIRELQDVQHRLLQAEEAERAHLARELHDQLGQELALLHLWLQTLRSRSSLPPADQSQLVRSADALTSALLERVRSLALHLRPAQLDDLGLAAALAGLARRVSRQSEVSVVAEMPELHERLPQPVETALFRVAQAAITNAIRHAGARLVRVRLTIDSRAACVVVEDNGCGFDLQAVTARRESGSGMGLLVMRERMQSIGGTMEIRTAPGQGTRVRACVALPAKEQA